MLNLTQASLLLLLAVLGVSCAKAPVADLVLLGGAVITVDKANPHASAVAVSGKHILAVGTDDQIRRHIKDGVTRVIELKGRSVLPGFNDAHAHIISNGEALEKIDLGGVDTFEEFARRVKQRVATAKPGEWLYGRGWDQSILPGKAWPTKELIDSVCPDNPVVLSRHDSHSRLVNSVVLKLSGITKDTPDPEGGQILRDPASGEPTGVLKENAMGLMASEPHDQMEDRHVAGQRHLRLSLAEARRLGVTSLTHFNGSEDLFEEALAAGELTFRVNVGHPLTADPEKLAEYHTLRDKYRDNEYIRFGPLKGFIDGTLGSATAAMFEPYSDDPSTSGTVVTPVEEMEAMILAADRDSFQVAIHAIGDRGSNIVLNAVEKAIAANGRRDARHRIEHAQILKKDDLPRFAALGVIASMQPTHCISDKHFAVDRLGWERCRYSYCWNSLREAGAALAFGTDCPIEPLDPLQGLYAAVTRKDRKGEEGPGWIPEEKITLEQAVEYYTLGSAYAEFRENEKGSLTPGKLADIVVLSSDIAQTPPDSIMQLKVDYTVFDGRIVYESGSN
ncbi:amidohydrolase [bacterium]|nr:amidohydrolase [bacterium]